MVGFFKYTGGECMPVNSFDDYYMSWRPKIERGKKALYLMIAEQLENDIKQGVILPGTKLPPQRELYGRDKQLLKL